MKERHLPYNISLLLLICNLIYYFLRKFTTHWAVMPFLEIIEWLHVLQFIPINRVKDGQYYFQVEYNFCLHGHYNNRTPVNVANIWVYYA